jgi:hypothetical protein
MKSVCPSSRVSSCSSLSRDYFVYFIYYIAKMQAYSFFSFLSDYFYFSLLSASLHTPFTIVHNVLFIPLVISNHFSCLFPNLLLVMHLDGFSG